MVANVLEVSVVVGDKVSVGETLLLLESMKMEFEVKAARDGIVEAIDVKPGDQVTAGQVLASFA